MLGTGSRQILVTFYRMPMCQRFPSHFCKVWPTHCQSSVPTDPHSMAWYSTVGLCLRQHPHQSIPPNSAHAPGTVMRHQGAAGSCGGMLKPLYVAGRLETSHAGNHAAEGYAAQLQQVAWDQVEMSSGRPWDVQGVGQGLEMGSPGRTGRNWPKACPRVQR